MIKLTVNPDLKPEVKTFSKSIVAIGSEVPSQADFSLPGETLQPVHIKIQEQDGRFIITNNANDPFVTLNGLPFGKKSLKNHDLIQIGNTIIRFEGENSKPFSVSEEVPSTSSHGKPHENWVDTEEKLNVILEQALASKLTEPNPGQRQQLNKDIRQDSAASPNYKREEFQESMDFGNGFDVESEMEKLEEQAEIEAGWNFDQMKEDDLEDLLNQVEELESSRDTDQSHVKESLLSETNRNPLSEHIQKSSAQHHKPLESNIHQQTVSVQPPAHKNGDPHSSPAPKHSKGSLKDYYLSEFDDESENWNQNKKSQKDAEQSAKWNWSLIAIIGCVILALILILGAFFYSNIRARNAEEEIRAAEGVADVAMALTYAQINHINPQNQNWSDPEFLKNNLMAVLASEYSPVATLDHHGQFSNNSYLLRIYTSNDLSQFLVIAQPAPSLLQWLIPKASILVDSKAMELRRTSDLKAMNRLLLNPTTLDGLSAMEVSNLVKHGENIPLATLAAKSGQDGFNLPKALAFIRPNAENFIYNAPRYYHFGESFLKKAHILNESPSNGYEVALLQQEMLELSKFSNLVLYSSQGMQWAAQAQKSINTFLPNNKLLVAYLTFNSKGKINSSHLLMDEGPTDVAQGPSVPAMPYSHQDMENPLIFGSTNGPALPQAICPNFRE